MTKGLRANKQDVFCDAVISLGLNPNLAALNRKQIRSQLAFMSPHGGADRLRAVKLLLVRIIQYYEVAGYVGPRVGRGGSDIGFALGDWVGDVNNPAAARRREYGETDIHAWKTPDIIFQDVRFLCTKTALRLAAWEFEQEVPESHEALKYACWATYGAITESQLARCNWRASRNRLGTKGIVKHLSALLAELELYRYKTNQQTPFVGQYEKLAAAAESV